MPSVLELAEICNASYDSNPNVDGWKAVKPFYNFLSNKGFFAAVFRKGEEHVMVFRGTDDETHDIVSDATLTLGYPPQQYYAAKQAYSMFSRKYPKYKNDVTFTGHSLGGGLAAILSARDNNLPVVTFNSPGMLRAATNAGAFGLRGHYNYWINKNGIRTYMNEFDKVLHIRSEWDLVSIGTGKKIISNTRTLANPGCPDIVKGNGIQLLAQATARAFCAHSMSNLLSVIRTMPEFRENIKW